MSTRSHNLKMSAAILAGGNAQRLGGIAKGNIKLSDGKTIINQLIREINKAGLDDVVIVANDSELYKNCGVEVIPDNKVGIGPMGGIEAGLSHFAGQSDAVMFIPCDMPNITAMEMKVLKKAFIETQAPVVFAETTGFFWHPLCTVVHIDLKGKISSAIDNGQRKIRDVWQQVKAIKVQFTTENAFFNINDSTDLDKWRKVENEKADLC